MDFKIKTVSKIYKMAHHNQENIMSSYYVWRYGIYMCIIYIYVYIYIITVSKLMSNQSTNISKYY